LRVPKCCKKHKQIDQTNEKTQIKICKDKEQNKQTKKDANKKRIWNQAGKVDVEKSK